MQVVQQRANALLAYSASIATPRVCFWTLCRLRLYVIICNAIILLINLVFYLIYLFIVYLFVYYLFIFIYLFIIYYLFMYSCLHVVKQCSISRKAP